MNLFENDPLWYDSRYLRILISENFRIFKRTVYFQKNLNLNIIIFMTLNKDRHLFYVKKLLYLRRTTYDFILLHIIIFTLLS